MARSSTATRPTPSFTVWALKRYNPTIKVVVEPAESSVLLGMATAAPRRMVAEHERLHP